MTGLGLATARSIFYRGMSSLTEYANFCDARNATLASVSRGGASKAQATQIGNAWEAVGVVAGCAPGSPPPPPCTGGPVQLGTVFSTPHPYGNNGDCTWTYTNSSGRSFAFVFDRLATEKDYDYVFVKDAAGNTVADYGFDARVVAC